MSATQEVIDAWYVSIDEQVYKPVTFVRLSSLAKRGKIRPTDKIRQSGQRWMQAGLLFGLFPDDYVNALAQSPQGSLPETLAIDGENKVAGSSIERDAKVIASFWSCRIQGTEYGPMHWDTVVNMVVTGELSANDQVRAELGSWMSAIKHPKLNPLFNLGATTSSHATISTQEITSLKAAEALNKNKEDAQRTERQSSANIHVIREPSKEELVEGWLSNSTVRTMAALVVGMVMLWAGYSYFNRVPARSYYDQLVEINEKFQSLKVSQSQPAVWEDASRQIQLKTAHMLKVLNKHASNDKPELQHLLWAVRDALPTMLAKGRDNVSESELYFLRELEAARRLIE